MFSTGLSIAQGLLVSIFSIVVVFFILLMISFLIDLVALVLKKCQKKSQSENDEVVAAITASITEYIGSDKFKIVSIKDK